MMKEKFNYRKLLIFLGLFIIITIFNYMYHSKIEVSSDSTTLIPMAKDFLKGNILLESWILGTNNFYFTDMIYFALGFLFQLKSSTLVYLIPAVVQAATVVLLIYFFFDFEIKGDGLKDKWCLGIGVLAVLAILGVTAPQVAYTLLNVNSHNIVYLYFILALMLVFRYIKDGKIPYLILYILLCMLSAFSDGVTQMVIFAPVCMCCIICIIKREDVRRNLIIFGGTVVGFIFSKLLLIIVEYAGGLVTRGLPLGLVSPLDWWQRIKDLGKVYFQFFNYKGIQYCSLLSSEGVYHIIITVYIILIPIILLYNFIFIFKISKKRMVLLWCSVINIVSCVATNVVVFNRYLAPFFIFGSMLLILTIYDLSIKFKNVKYLKASVLKGVNYVYVCVLCAALLFTGAYKLNLIHDMGRFGDLQRQVACVLTEKQWGNGYGDFWSSSLISYYTDFQCEIYPVNITAGSSSISPYVELVSERWYEEKDKHFIIRYSVVTTIDMDTMISLIGQPEEMIEIGPYTLFYWSKDISDYVIPYDGGENLVSQKNM